MKCHLKLLGGTRTSSAAFLMSCFALPALAQETDAMAFCAYQPSLEDIVGDYTVTTGPGVLSSGGYKIPMPNVQTHRATLALIDGVLVLYVDDTAPIDLLPAGDSEPDW